MSHNYVALLVRRMGGEGLRFMNGGVSADSAYHVLNRGNGGGTVFHKDGDYTAFLQLLGTAKAKFPVKVLGLCLMPNCKLPRRRDSH